MDRSYYTKLGTTSTEGYPKSMMTLNPKMLLLLENTALTSTLWSRPFGCFFISTPQRKPQHPPFFLLDITSTTMTTITITTTTTTTTQTSHVIGLEQPFEDE